MIDLLKKWREEGKQMKNRNYREEPRNQTVRKKDNVGGKEVSVDITLQCALTDL